MSRLICERHTTPKGNVSYDFRGSSLGGCIHSHIACLRGLKEGAPDASLREVFSAGNTAEVAQKKLLKSLPGIVILEDASGYGNQEPVVIWDFKEEAKTGVKLFCSPDGLIEITDWRSFLDACARCNIAVNLRCSNEEPALFCLENKLLGEKPFEKAKKSGLDSFFNYKYQTSGVCHGYRDLMKTAGVGIAFMAQRRGYEVTPESLAAAEVQARDNQRWNDANPDSEPRPVIIEPKKRHVLKDEYVLWLYDEPAYTRAQTLQRCWDIVAAYEAGEWPKCDSEYQCRWPHKPSAVPDGVAVEILTHVHELAAQLDAAYREAEYLLAGADLSEPIHGFEVFRETRNVPVVRRAS